MVWELPQIDESVFIADSLLFSFERYFRVWILQSTCGYIYIYMLAPVNQPSATTFKKNAPTSMVSLSFSLRQPVPPIWHGFSLEAMLSDGRRSWEMRQDDEVLNEVKVWWAFICLPMCFFVVVVVVVMFYLLKLCIIPVWYITFLWIYLFLYMYNAWT